MIKCLIDINPILINKNYQNSNNNDYNDNNNSHNNNNNNNNNKTNVHNTNHRILIYTGVSYCSYDKNICVVYRRKMTLPSKYIFKVVLNADSAYLTLRTETICDWLLYLDPRCST